MKISRKVWDKYIQTLRRLDDKAATELTNYYVRILGEGLSDDEISRRLTNMAYALATKYGEAASAASCEMYDAVAETSDVVVPPAMPAKTATYSETAKAINRAMSFSTNENVIGAVAGRLVKMAGVDTTMQNAIRDGAEWAWVPSGDTCAFCLTLASRGWLPASEEQIKGGHAEHIHANCDCTFAIRFDKNTQVEGYDPDELKRQYYAAEGSSSKDKINYMRRQKYAANKDKINAQKRMAYLIRKSLTSDGSGAMMASDKYVMPREKIENFLLKPGAKHSKEFFDLGYTPDDANKLNEEIDEQFDETKAFDIRTLPDGAQRFSIEMFFGITKKKPFQTVWQKETQTNTTRFITAYRRDDK